MLMPSSLSTVTELIMSHPQLSTIAGVTFITFQGGRAIKNYFTLKKKELKAKGIGRKTKNNNLKVKFNKKGLLFTKYNLAMTQVDFLAIKPWLEGLYNTQFKDPIIIKRTLRQSSIFFKVQKFKRHKIYRPQNKKKNILFLGIDDNNQEVYKDSFINNSILIRGSQGSGKSSTIRSILLALLINNPNYEAVCVDTKEQELGDIINFIHKLDDVDSYIFLNEQLDLIIQHCLNKKGNRKFIILLDESIDYLSKEIDPDPDIQEQKKILLQKTLKIIRKLRSYGVIVIIGVQDISTNAIQIPPSLIKLTLTSKISTTQQAQALGLSLDSMDSDLQKGRWILGKNQKVQFPELIKHNLAKKLKGVIDA